jgi:hypothetical protein
MAGCAPGGEMVSAWTFVGFCRGNPCNYRPYGARTRRAETVIMETAVETRTALEVRAT